MVCQQLRPSALMPAKIKDFLLLYFSAQFLKFLFSGSMSALVNWSTRLILHQILEVDSDYSFIIAYFLGLLTAFLLYRKFVFPYSFLPSTTQSIRFLIVNFSFFPIVFFAFNFLVDLLLSFGMGDYAHPVSHVLVIGLPAVITFLLYKFFAFKSQEI